MEVIELFKAEQKYWKKKNIELFGITPIDETKPFSVIQQSIDESCEKYWNSDKPCKLVQLLNDGTLDRDYILRYENSYRLQLNIMNMCIDVFATYDVKGTPTELMICSLPTPDVDLTWIINKAHYVPRITSSSDSNTIVSRGRNQNMIYGEFWNYNMETDKFTCILKKNAFEPTVDEIFKNHLSKRSRALLQALLGDEKLTKDNFTKALGLIPNFPYNSIYSYKFTRFEYFEDLVLGAKRYAQPLKKILLGINTTFISQAKQYTSTGEKLEGQLILTTSPIFALENFRTCINIFRSETGYQPTFTYVDSSGFFDSFKTSTSMSAGRQRLLLDNISVKDGMLWVREEDGTEHNMFEYMNKPQNKRISCLSYSPFCHNNKAKRIMMTAKMSSQAVPLKNEKDSLTHRIPARVVFADIEGYTYADAIVISESFAKRLTTYGKDIIIVEKNSDIYKMCMAKSDAEKGKSKLFKPLLSLDDLKVIYPNKQEVILDSYKNVKVDLIDDVDANFARVFISWEIPFGLGDKISNLHGAKGVVGKILPDDEMPTLVKKVGLMKPGPMDVVISGFSTIRRGSLGQLFEAWMNATGTKIREEDQFISKVASRYSNEIQKFARDSVISFNGEEMIKPIGIIDMIRLYHHASIHISESGLDKDFNKMLKFGEMEKFNLLSSKSTKILEELSIRSMQKYVGSHKLVTEMERDRKLPEDPILSLRFARILKSFGYDILLDNKPLVISDLSRPGLLDEEDEKQLNAWEFKEDDTNENSN